MSFPDAAISLFGDLLSWGLSKLLGKTCHFTPTQVKRISESICIAAIVIFLIYVTARYS